MAIKWSSKIDEESDGKKLFISLSGRGKRGDYSVDGELNAEKFEVLFWPKGGRDLAYTIKRNLKNLGVGMSFANKFDKEK